MVKTATGAGPRVAIVTGAGTGLGRAYALRLAADGLRVIVNNRRREVDESGRGSADRVVEEIRASGGTAIANHDDVCSDGAGARMVGQALDSWGRLDVLVNNAGVEQHAAFHRITLEDFHRILAINLTGTVDVTHAAWTHMRGAGHGRVIVSASSAGLHGLHGLSAYAASKAALVAFARSIAAEGASRDLFCNAIAPYAATRMTAPYITDSAQREAAAPEMVAALVAALVSEQCDVNGQVIVVGHGGARCAATVEFSELVSIGPKYSSYDATQQFQRPLLDVPGLCREFSDGRASFEDFAKSVARGLQGRQDAE